MTSSASSAAAASAITASAAADSDITASAAIIALASTARRLGRTGNDSWALGRDRFLCLLGSALDVCTRRHGGA